MAHALLSPSSAHRWINCPAAPRLEEGIEDKGSPFAAEGTLAHAYCAKKLKEHLGLPTDHEQAEIMGLNDTYHAGEMDEHTDTYVTIVLEKLNAARKHTPDAQLLVETRLDFSDRVPEAFGTADAIIIADGTMEVIDFKYGKGVQVSAEHNPQMMIYALGAYDMFGFDYDIRSVQMTIVQPRIDNLSEWSLSTDELLQWADSTLSPAAAKAHKGEGGQHPGGWCKFCKVKGSCRALATQCTQIAEQHRDCQLLSADELATQVLPQLATVKAWLANVEDYALQQAMSGVKLIGWKVVEGRSIRRINDTQGAAEALRGAGFKDESIFKPQELRTITDLEKTAGKKLFATVCGEFIDKPKGKPTLAPESDKRPAIDPVADDFDNI